MEWHLNSGLITVVTGFKVTLICSRSCMIGDQILHFNYSYSTNQYFQSFQQMDMVEIMNPTPKFIELFG